MALWWQRGVVYQIYPRSFMDANGDGIGDLAGVESRLDHLAWLGVDAIWFSPLFPSPMADFGYDVADYTDIHPDYGDLAAFDRLLAAAHQRGIRVLLDLVPNHSSIEHPWFQESRQSRESARRDWYIWKDPAPDGGPPNNWMAYFGGPAWTFDDATGQYYMHNFDPGQPELNWRNPAVKQAMFDVIRFWLDRGVDGFRVDVIDRLLKDPDFRDNPPNPDWQPGDPEIGRVLREHSEKAPGIHALMREFRQVFDAYNERVIVGELRWGEPAEEYASYYGGPGADGLGDELHLPFNFGLLLLPWRADALRDNIAAYDASVPPHGWPNYVLGNHDIGRIASRIGPEQAANAALLLLTLRGTPTVYYGEELGMENVPIPPERVQDPQGRNGVGFNRDECRTPMQWDASTNAGFSTAAQTWLPLAPDYTTRNVAAQREDPASMLNFYRRLLAVRRANPALHIGTMTLHDDLPAGALGWSRQHEDDHWLTLLNLTGEPIHLSLPDIGTARLVVATDYRQEGLDADTADLTLPANAGLLLQVKGDPS